MPTTNHKIIKKAIFVVILMSSIELSESPPAMAESITMITILSTSSITNTLKTKLAKRCCFSFSSLKVLYTMVELLHTENTDAKKIRSIDVHPNSQPAV